MAGGADNGLVIEGLVATKLAPLVPDPRAINREPMGALGRGQTPVTVIVAPAGSGKSTLMAQLHARTGERGVPCCWLSLEAEDNDPATFAIYLISALDGVDRGFAREELIALEANPRRDFDSLFDRLLSRLSLNEAPRALFLDDAQHLSDGRILRFLDKLLAHLPRGLELVIASRSRLPLQLARLRVAGKLAEIGQEELNFDSEQAGQFLSRYHQLELEPRDLQALLDSTEGWPTGVQLAALALRRHKGAASELIGTFSGRDRNLTHYLVESVLLAQREPIRRFLMRTAPLRRMCADLCHAATGQDEAGALLEEVGSANLFLIPLDREGVWYRYHHLFGEFLQGSFRAAEPDEYRAVCHRAATWCEANGQPAEAVRYALEAEHYEEAADLIARHAPRASMYRGDHYSVLDWMRRLPAEYHTRHPDILLAHAWSCAFSRETAQAMTISQRALQLLDAGHWPLDEAGRARYELLTRNVQAAAATCADTIDDCIARAVELRDKVPESEPFVIATLGNCLAYGYFVKRDFARCGAAAVDAHDYGHRADAAYLSAWGDFLHGLAHVEQGRLREAELCGRSVRKDAQGLGQGQRNYVAGLSALLDAEIAVQRGDFRRAGEAIVIGGAFKEIFGPTEPQLVAVRNEARLHAQRGRLDDARVVLQEGQDAALREEHLRMHLVLAIEEATLQLLAGDLDGANATARKWKLRGPAAEALDRPGLFRGQREALRLLEARFRIAEDQPEQALRALTLLQQARGAETQGGHALSVTTLRAVALWNQGKRKEAARQLDAALQAAATEFHAWPLLSAGRALLPVLEAIREQRGSGGEVADLRVGLPLQEWLIRQLRGEPEPRAAEPDPAAASVPSSASGPTAGGSAVVAGAEPLTPREIDLLRLLQSGLDNRQLAKALLLSESTVKWHLHNVYGKLGVKRRGAAVAKAAAAGLI